MIYKKSGTDLRSFSDASFGIKNSKKGIGGGLIYLGDNLIAHYTSGQGLSSTSSFECEMLEVSRIAKEVLTARGLLRDCGYQKLPPTLIFTDAQVVKQSVESLIRKRKTRHFSLKIAQVIDLVERNVIKVHKVLGEQNPADVLTKNLLGDHFTRLSGYLFNISSFPRRHVGAIWDLAETFAVLQESKYVIHLEDDLEDKQDPFLLGFYLAEQTRLESRV